MAPPRGRQKKRHRASEARTEGAKRGAESRASGILPRDWCKNWPILRLRSQGPHRVRDWDALDMASQSARKRIEDEGIIPDRLYFKIGDVARICGVETYVLRFWETQFPQLKPNKSGTGQRLYRKREVELALAIKRLVHGEGYTLAGARQALGQLRRAGPESKPARDGARTAKDRDAVAAAVGHARAELREIAGMLAQPEPQLPKRRPRATALRDLSGSLFPS